MEDLLEDEDEDFDKDDKVITSRQASTKKKKMFARTSLCASLRRGLTYTKNTHTNTLMNKMTFFPFPAVSSPLPRSTVRRDLTAPRNLFILTSVKKGTFPTFPGIRLSFFPLLQSFLDLCLFFPTRRRIYDTDAVIPPPASCENTRLYKVLS